MTAFALLVGVSLMAARCGFAEALLGRRSMLRESAFVGFCGIRGCTPSTASQWAISNYLAFMCEVNCMFSPVKDASRGTFGSGALMSFSKSTSSSST